MGPLRPSPTSRTPRARLAGQAVRTPLIRSDVLDALTGARVFLKAEPLQRTGSFKFRGAYNRLSRLSAAERGPGVVAFSSGNHAQGVAQAARLVGCPAVIVMPSDAPQVKIEATRALGAKVVLYDRDTESREGIAARIAGERGAVVVPAFDDFHVIAGQARSGWRRRASCRRSAPAPTPSCAPSRARPDRRRGPGLRGPVAGHEGPFGRAGRVRRP